MVFDALQSCCRKDLLTAFLPGKVPKRKVAGRPATSGSGVNVGLPGRDAEFGRQAV